MRGLHFSHWQRALLSFFLTVCLPSCNCQRGNAIIIDSADSANVDLLDLGTGTQLIPIPSEYDMGDITYAKVTGEYYFFFDEARKSIHIMDNRGEFQEFNRLGRGAGEYLDIGAFSFDKEKNELVIYERSTRCLKFYSLSDYSKTRERQLDYYINAFECISGDELLVFRENWKSYSSAVVRIDLETGSEETLLPLRADQILILEDYALSKSEDDGIYFGITGEKMTFYRYGEDLQILSSLEFRPTKLSRNYWEGDFSEKKEKELLRILQKPDIELAMAPCAISAVDGDISFWYAIRPSKTAHQLPEMRCCVMRSGQIALFKRIGCRDLGIDSLQPIASHGKQTLTLLDAELLSPRKGTELGDKFISLKQKGYNRFVLAYGLF